MKVQATQKHLLGLLVSVIILSVISKPCSAKPQVPGWIPKIFVDSIETISLQAISIMQIQILFTH